MEVKGTVGSLFNAQGYPLEAKEYKKIKLVGEGAYASVYMAECTKMDGKTEIVSAKVSQVENQEEISDTTCEILVLSLTECPALLHKLASFVNIDDTLDIKESWIITQYAKFGSCKQLMSNFPTGLDPYVVGYILRNTLQALCYLHKDSLSIAHRDVKAANILLFENGDCKLADFGVCKCYNEKEQVHSCVGSPYWMAPEVLQKLPSNLKSDIWSLGILAIELLFNYVPHYNKHPIKAMMEIHNGDNAYYKNLCTSVMDELADERKFELMHIPESFKLFVKDCCNVNPLLRPSASSLLNHKFIKKYGKKLSNTDIVRSLE